MPIFHFLLLCLSPLMPTTSPTAGSMIFQFFFMVCLSRKTLRYSCCHLRHTASLHLMICFFLRSLSSMLSRSSSGIDVAFSSVIMFGVRSGSCIWSFFLFFLIGIHSTQGWTATTRHGVTRKRSTKRLKHTGNLLRKTLQLIGVC